MLNLLIQAMNRFSSKVAILRDRSFIALSLTLAFLLTLRSPRDPDLGWHLRNGEDILKFGVPRGDSYSYTMPGYPWISHERLTDVLLYLGSHYWGLLFLVVLFALIAVAAYLLASRVSRVSWPATVLTTLIAILVAYPIVGVRPQLITLLGLAAILWILFRWREKPENKLIFWLIPLMLIWVNLHGGFMAGLILMGAFGVFELAKYIWKRSGRHPKLQNCHPGSTGQGPSSDSGSRPGFQIESGMTKGAGFLSAKELWQLVWVGLLSGAVTLVNPYTWRVYEEFVRTVFNDLVKSNISEWLPVDLGSVNGFNLLIYAILLAIFVLMSWRKMDGTKIFIGIVFFVISISSWRNMPLFPLVALPLLGDAVAVLLPAGIRYYTRSVWIGFALLIGVGYYGYVQSLSVVPLSTNQESLFRAAGYPVGAVQYIKEHHLPGNLFNEYGWGGYLIWQLPEKPVFIDGRMAIWQTPTQNLFKEYTSLSVEDEPTTAILNKYKADLILIKKQSQFAQYFLRNSDGWEALYQDNNCWLFGRVHPLPI